MSSDVHAKWMNSATRAISGTPAKRSFSQYSTALTSWLVVRSIALTRAASAGANAAAASSIAARAAAENGGSFGDRRLVGERREPRELDAHAMADRARTRRSARAAPRPWPHSGHRAATARSTHAGRHRRSCEYSQVLARRDMARTPRMRRVPTARDAILFVSRHVLSDAHFAQADRQHDESVRAQGPHRARREEVRVPALRGVAVDAGQSGARASTRSARSRC